MTGKLTALFTFHPLKLIHNNDYQLSASKLPFQPQLVGSLPSLRNLVRRKWSRWHKFSFPSDFPIGSADEREHRTMCSYLVGFCVTEELCTWNKTKVLFRTQDLIKRHLMLVIQSWVLTLSRIVILFTLSDCNLLLGNC